MGGSNNHIIVSEYPNEVLLQYLFSLLLAIIHIPSEVLAYKEGSTQNKYLPILLSAHTPQVLNKVVHNIQEFLGSHTKENNNISLEQLSFTLSLHRTHHSYRANFVVDSIQSLVRELTEYNTRQDKAFTGKFKLTLFGVNLPFYFIGVSEIVYVCSGQGPEWFAMGRGLLEAFPLYLPLYINIHRKWLMVMKRYKKTISEISELLQPLTGWSLLAELMNAEEHSLLQRIEYSQPAIFSMQVISFGNTRIFFLIESV